MMLRKLLTLALMALALFTTGAVFFERGPNEVIFPKQSIPIYFTHNYHVRKPDKAKGIEGEGLSCEFCHENVAESKVSSDADIPGHDSCDTCHDEWIGDEDEPAPIDACGKCHVDLQAKTTTVAAKITVPKPNIVFPHETHVEKDIACTECHRQVPNKAVASQDDFPTMDQCIACHQDRGAPTTCNTCHVMKPSGLVETEYTSGTLMPSRYHVAAIHEGDFLRQHAVPAQRNRALCEQCHTKSDCLECHDGIGRDVRYHPGDWISMHFLSARQDKVRCESCHRFQTFCLNCHVRSGVATVATTINAPLRSSIRRPAANAAPTGPHPMGPEWTGEGQSTLGRNFHGFHAQRNIRACVSCHQEQFCLQCHANTRGGNPHGPNPQRLRGSTASKRNARVCLKCHDPGDPSWR